MDRKKIHLPNDWKLRIYVSPTNEDVVMFRDIHTDEEYPGTVKMSPYTDRHDRVNAIIEGCLSHSVAVGDLYPKRVYVVSTPKGVATHICKNTEGRYFVREHGGLLSSC